jgi:hypothetical protein
MRQLTLATVSFDADKLPHRHRLIQRFLGRRIRQVEPMLQQVQSQHALQANRRPAVAGLRVARLDIGGNRGRAGFDPAVIGVDRGGW